MFTAKAASCPSKAVTPAAKDCPININKLDGKESTRMPSERFILRVPLGRLLIGLLLTVIPISLIGLFALAQSEKSLEESVGTNYRTIAEATSGEVSSLSTTAFTTWGSWPSPRS